MVKESKKIPRKFEKKLKISKKRYFSLFFFCYFRSERNDKVDSTPRATPAHKFNSWARERKKTGATPMPGKSKL